MYEEEGDQEYTEGCSYIQEGNGIPESFPTERDLEFLCSPWFEIYMGKSIDELLDDLDRKVEERLNMETTKEQDT